MTVVSCDLRIKERLVLHHVVDSKTFPELICFKWSKFSNVIENVSDTDLKNSLPFFDLLKRKESCVLC